MDDRNNARDGKTGPARRDLLRAGSLMWVPGLASAAGWQMTTSRAPRNRPAGPDIVIENAAFRFVIGADGVARSLVDKASGQECLMAGTNTPVFSMTQYAPLAGQLILLHPADAKTFNASTVKRDGDRLSVSFEGVPHEVLIRLKVAPGYVAFTVEQTRTEGKGWAGPDVLKTPIENLVFMQLPVRERTNFGQWLNVEWDDEVAVNLLAADPWCRIDAQPRAGYRLLRAATEERVKTIGVTAALIVTPTAKLLDRIAGIEADYHLPRGVESRRRKEARYSYYWASGVTPATIDRHIEYARTGGFPAMMISYREFSKTAGHFPWRPEYPGGMEDLRAVVGKVKAAGIVPGVHIHYSKADRSDSYVSGKADPRLAISRVFTLASPLDTSATAIAVEENPFGTTLDDQRRIIRIGTELVTYENFTTVPPYQFTGCRRAQLNTRAAAYDTGVMFAVLDVDTWPLFVRFNQNTTIQQEVAGRIASFYDAGFEFLYYDGAEDVHAPFWFTTGWAQQVVYQALRRPPLFAEGAQRAHYNWHILSRSNAYDIQQPEAMKDAMHVYQEVQAPRTAKDFTGINFGWMGYTAPGARSIGTQPDLVEYVVSRAAAWDCPFSLNPRLQALDGHPRTPDNLEVMRRWQEVVLKKWLSPEQKRMLREPDRDYTLLIDEDGRFEMVACDRIEEAAANGPVRAFLFERGGKPWVVYWHPNGRGSLQLPLRVAGLRLWSDAGRNSVPVERSEAGLVLPLEGRRYLECAGISRAEVLRAFQNAKVFAA